MWPLVWLHRSQRGISAKVGGETPGFDGISFCLDMTHDTAQMKSLYKNPDLKSGNDFSPVLYNGNADTMWSNN